MSSDNRVVDKLTVPKEAFELRRLQREVPPSPFMFVSERGAPFTTAGFARMLERAAASAGLDIKVHPHIAAARLWLRAGQPRT